MELCVHLAGSGKSWSSSNQGNLFAQYWKYLQQLCGRQRCPGFCIKATGGFQTCYFFYSHGCFQPSVASSSRKIFSCLPELYTMYSMYISIVESFVFPWVNCIIRIIILKCQCWSGLYFFAYFFFWCLHGISSCVSPVVYLSSSLHIVCDVIIHINALYSFLYYIYSLITGVLRALAAPTDLAQLPIPICQ